VDKYTTRRNDLLKNVRGRVKRSGLDAFLVTGEKDIFYLTGYFCENAKLLVTAGTRSVYFIDNMNEELGRKMLRGLELGEIIAGPVHAKLGDFIKAAKIKKVGINENNISASEYRSILGKRSFKFRHIPNLLEDMRCIKQGYEIDILRRAARETVRIWRQVKKNVESGMSEKDIADMINVLIRALGHENAFSPVVAVGENTAYPHAIPGSRRLGKGEHLLVDFGVRVEGYCSDLTRTYSMGRIDRKIKDFRDLVHRAHDRIIKMVKPGVTTGFLNKAMAKYFNNNNKISDRILHVLGHGVGLDIHERPFFREGCSERLRKGMVITIEPGLYEPGLGGIREEDTVLVTAKGCEVLTA
jgi:Xaa-Pro aminopeptidase